MFNKIYFQMYFPMLFYINILNTKNLNVIIIIQQELKLRFAKCHHSRQSSPDHIQSRILWWSWEIPLLSVERTSIDFWFWWAPSRLNFVPLGRQSVLLQVDELVWKSSISLSMQTFNCCYQSQKWHKENKVNKLHI